MLSARAIASFVFTVLMTSVSKGSEWNLEEELSYPTPARDSPLFPDLLESLSKQKNSPDTAHYIRTEYDYIIVGAGAAGSAVAARLSEEPCVSVLLLEAGPPPPKLSDVVPYLRSFWDSPNLDWLLKTVPQRHTGRGLLDRKVKIFVGKSLGGSTMHNHGVHIRGNRKDYDDWANMGAEGWSFKEVLPYFMKLEDNRDLEYARNGYHGIGGPVTVEKPRYTSEIKQPLFEAINAMGYRFVDPNTGLQTGFYDVQSNLRFGQRCSTAKAYLVPVENRTNLDILPNAFVRKVNIVNSQAVGVLFDYNSQTYNIQARREIILSAGAIKTPQILMLSGIGPEDHLRQFNIPVHANLPVGLNFQDHAAMQVNFVLRPHIQELSQKFRDEANVKEYILNRSGPLASVEGLAYVAFLHNDDINPATDSPNYQIYFWESSSSTTQRDQNLKSEVYQQVYGPYENRSQMACVTQMLNPKSRGTVQLQSANPYDPPLIDPNYLADPSDIEDMVEGMKTCKRIGERPEMKQVIEETFQTLYPGCEEFSNDEDAYFRCVLRTVVFSYPHYCCTARMGNYEDPTTVLDPQLRVKYIRGLRVADNSVMPTIISGNTGVPAIMIGEKAADMIKETIQCVNYNHEIWK